MATHAPELVAAAAEAVVRNQLATATLIARELDVDPLTALDLLEALETAGVVAAAPFARSHAILTRVEDLAAILADIRRGAA